MREEIQSAQLAAVEAVEAQLAAGAKRIEVEGHTISAEAAWAATQAIRACWSSHLRYDGQERDHKGVWWARGELSPGKIGYIALGEYRLP